MRTATRGAVAALGLAVLLAGCSVSDDGKPSSAPSTPPTTVSPTTSGSSVTSATPTASPSSTSTGASPTASSTPTSTAPSSSPVAGAAPFTTTCTDLMVMVIKGGAIRGAEIAAMQFTNTGSTTCTITGTPTAHLVRKGARIGSVSLPNGDAVRPFTLQPGDVGESLLRDFSTCNAPLSDKLRLRLPSRNGTPGRTVTEPVTLRACDLRVAPVGAPA